MSERTDPGEPVATIAPVSDAGLDAIHTGDRAYLNQLGYRQELNRVLGFFSNFAVQWTCIAVAGGPALSIGAGVLQVGGVFFVARVMRGGVTGFVRVGVF